MSTLHICAPEALYGKIALSAGSGTPQRLRLFRLTIVDRWTLKSVPPAQKFLPACSKSSHPPAQISTRRLRSRPAGLDLDPPARRLKLFCPAAQNLTRHRNLIQAPSVLDAQEQTTKAPLPSLECELIPIADGVCSRRRPKCRRSAPA